MKMENWLEVINREIREMQKHNKFLEKLIKQNDERIIQNETRIQQNEERIQQNEVANRDTLLRTEYFIVQQMRPWWKKFFGIQEKFELKR